MTHRRSFQFSGTVLVKSLVKEWCISHKKFFKSLVNSCSMNYLDVSINCRFNKLTVNPSLRLGVSLYYFYDLSSIFFVISSLRLIGEKNPFLFFQFLASCIWPFLHVCDFAATFLISRTVIEIYASRCRHYISETIRIFSTWKKLVWTNH